MFDCVSKITIVVLHGRKTVNRVNMNTFDQAANEHTPFDNNMRNALLRFCWCHRGAQKTKPICRRNSPAVTRLALRNFDISCDYVACGVENEKECALLMNFIRQHVDIQQVCQR